MPQWKDIDPTLLLLFAGIFLTLGVLVYIEHMFKGEANCFQVVAGLVGSFSGALFTKLKVEGKSPDKKEDKPNV